MPRPRARTVLGVALPILVVMVFFTAWALDTNSAAGGSVRNVEVGGRDVGGMTEAEVRQAVAKEALDLARVKVQIDTGARTLEAQASEVGLALDQEATVKAVLEQGRDGAAPLRPFAWARSFVAPHEVDPRITIRTDRLAVQLTEMEGEDSRMPVEPSIVASPETVRVQSGVAGKALDPDTVAERLLAAARAGEDPITIDAEPENREPRVSDAEARALADEAAELTSQPFGVTVAGKSVSFDVPMLRAWVGSKVTSNGIELDFDEERIAADLRDQVGSLGDAQPRSASFTVEGGAVRLIPAVEGITCCAEDAPTQIVEALEAGQRLVEVQPERAEPELTTEEAQALGIKEPVGTTTEWKGVQQVKSFTTYHDCCAARVTNIHRIADLVRGAIVMPGETFSVNGHVGQRTTDKGFVVAGAIANGEHVEEVGGGVSQFATTLFNAAFFAGLPFGEYQAHSEHFDRYPRGREATMGYEHPDLQFKNDTPYGILIWTSYTDTSVTVTLYSTQYAYGQQTGQSESSSGGCTSVTTTRTITYPGGRTATDTVRARYRNPGVTRCG